MPCLYNACLSLVVLLSAACALCKTPVKEAAVPMITQIGHTRVRSRTASQ